MKICTYKYVQHIRGIEVQKKREKHRAAKFGVGIRRQKQGKQI